MGSVIVTITADWEGIDTQPGNLQAIRALGTHLSMFGKGFNGKEIPITHFICPAYFTRTLVSGERQEIAKRIRESGAIRNVDEIAVHIHSWQSLALEAGIPLLQFQDGPRGDDRIGVGEFKRGEISGPDLGYNVPLGTYPVAHIIAYLNTSIGLLRAFVRDTDLVSFRTGMWVTCDAILAALQSTSLRYEASAMPFKYVQDVVIPTNIWGRPAYLDWNIAIWSNARTDNPVYLINHGSNGQYPQGIYGMGPQDQPISQPMKVGNITEIPDTGILLPFTNYALLVSFIDYAFSTAKKDDKSVYISIGFHQENAGNTTPFFTPKFPLAPQEIYPNPRVNAIWMAANHAIDQAKSQNVGLEFLTIQEVGQRFG